MLTYQFLRRTFLQPLWEGNDDGGSGTGTGTGDPDPGATARTQNQTGTQQGTGDDQGSSQGTGSSTEDQFTGLRSALDSEREQRKELAKELKELKRGALPEGEKLKVENEELKGTVTDLTKQLAELKVGSTITEQARALNFKRPERALKALQLYTDVDVSTLDTDAKVKAALENLAKAESDLVSTPPPSGGPIIPESGQRPSGNSGFNQEIRRRAGRVS